jgi:hypothetical protein
LKREMKMSREGKVKKNMCMEKKERKKICVWENERELLKKKRKKERRKRKKEEWQERYERDEWSEKRKIKCKKGRHVAERRIFHSFSNHVQFDNEDIIGAS